MKYSLQKQQLSNFQTQKDIYYNNGYIKCSDKNNNGNTQNFIKSTETNSPSGDSGTTRLLLIGESSLYIETSFNIQGIIVFVSFERTDIIQVSNIKIYYNRFSILTSGSLKSRGRFRIQLFLEDNTLSTRYNLPKIGRYSDSSTQ